MKNYRLKINTLLSVTVIITLIVLIISLYYNDFIERSDIFKVFGIYGTITAIVSIIWTWFRKKGWKIRLFQKNNLINLPPDLTGRWEGTFIRPELENSYPFVIEIEQTIDTIVLNTYSRKGHSESSVYNILTNELKSTFYLGYLWEGKAGKNSSIKFAGFTILKLIENKGNRKLTGTYFTDREPQTKGKITVHWKSKQLKKEF